MADDQLLKFTLDGKFVLQIGKSNQSKGDTDTANVHRAADAWVLPRTNEIFVADGYGNHRVIVFDADTGAFKRTWGAFGKPPGGKDNCAIARLTEFSGGRRPAGLQRRAFHPAWRTTARSISPTARTGACSMFTSDGKFVKQLRRTAAPFAANLAFSPDPEQQFLYIGSGKVITIADRKTLDVLGRGRRWRSSSAAATTSRPTPRATSTSPHTAAGMQRLTFKGMTTAALR